MVTGLATNDPTPGNFIQINFAQGDSGGGVTEYPVLLMGNKLSTGVAELDGYVYGPDTDVQLLTEQSAIDLFGQGSELHLMYKEFRAVNKVSSLYAIAVTESVGSKATGLIRIANTATADGEVLTQIGNVVVSAAFADADTASEIGDLVAASINANKNLPVTAANVSGDVTLTAKQAGPRGNLIRYSASISPSTGVSTVVSEPTAHTFMSGGTTADDFTAALATVVNTRYYYYVPACVDATNLDLVADQCDEVSGALVGNTARWVAGSVDTLGNLTSLATTLNRARGELVWLEKSDKLPSQMAANAAAAYSLFETDLTQPFAMNFNGFGSVGGTNSYWNVPAPKTGFGPSRDEIKSALNNGITPLKVARGGTSIVRRVTNKSLNGAVNDYRVRDACKVTVSDKFADDLRSAYQASFSGKLINNNPINAQVTSKQAVTPRQVEQLIYKQLDLYRNDSLIEDVDTVGGSKESLSVERETVPSTRFSVRIKLKVSDILNSSATDVDEVSSNG